MVEKVADKAEKLRVGVLASGGGTDLQSLIDACEAGRVDGAVVVVVSNNSKAGALERARRHGIPAHHLSNYHYPDDADLDRAFVELLRSYGVNLVAFAGYMKKRGGEFIAAFPNRILNIHPALLPGPHGGPGKYGLRVHESVLAAGDKTTGVTIHLVDERYDHGPVVARREVPVLPDDTPESLQQRVLAAEHELYPAVLAGVARGEIDLDAVAAGGGPAPITERET
jgi:phosphoribosylglycinamide formyltransferase-1